MPTAIEFNHVSIIIETVKYGFLSTGIIIGWGWLAYSFVLWLFFWT